MKVRSGWYEKDIVHIDAVLSLAAVTLEIELAQLLLLIRNNVFVIELALVALRERQIEANVIRGDFISH